MNNDENSTRKVKRNKPAYDEVVPLSEEGNKKRLKGMAWLKKEQQKQNAMVEQEIESAPVKKKFSVTGMMKFKRQKAEPEVSMSNGGKKVSNKKSNKEIIEEIAKEEATVLKQLGTLLMSSRRYIITVLITIVIMGGVFGAMNYFSAKDKDDSINSEEESTMQVESEKPAAVVENNETNAAPTPVADSLDAEEDNTAEETTDSTTEFITGSESEDAEVVIKEPEDLLPAVDPADVAVAVYNGSGIPGLAGLYAEKIETLGFNVADVGNADSFDYIFSEINYTAEVASVREQIGDVLVGASQSQEKVDQDYDIILIIGKNEDTN